MGLMIMSVSRNKMVDGLYEACVNTSIKSKYQSKNAEIYNHVHAINLALYDETLKVAIQDLDTESLKIIAVICFEVVHQVLAKEEKGILTDLDIGEACCFIYCVLAKKLGYEPLENPAALIPDGLKEIHQILLNDFKRVHDNPDVSPKAFAEKIILY